MCLAALVLQREVGRSGISDGRDVALPGSVGFLLVT